MTPREIAPSWRVAGSWNFMPSPPPAPYAMRIAYQKNLRLFASSKKLSALHLPSCPCLPTGTNSSFGHETIGWNG